MDLRLALMCGTDIPIPECKLVIHQPTLKEISYIGEKVFFTGIQCLCINKSMFSEDKNALDNTSNFQIFMTVMTEKEAKDKKEDTMRVLSLLFPEYKILFTPRAVTFMKQQENIMIDGDNFDAFQEVLRLIFCTKEGPMDQQSFNPADEKARKIAEKIMRGRQRVAEQNGNINVSVFTQYLSILTVGLHSMSLSDLMQLTMYQLYDLVERFMLYTSWNLDTKVRLAGGKPDEQVDNWMKNIHS